MAIKKDTFFYHSSYVQVEFTSAISLLNVWLKILVDLGIFKRIILKV